LDSVHGHKKIGLGEVVGDTGSSEDADEEVRDNTWKYELAHCIRGLDLTRAYKLLTIASPLAKERSEAVDQETVNRSPVAEERAVIPPSLVGAVGLQMRLVLKDLELDPLAIWVPVSVVLGQESLSLVLLTVYVVPSGRLGQKPGENKDKTREQHLEPDRHEPRCVARDVEGASVGTRSNDSTNRPTQSRFVRMVQND
jgi:hypothetical protein